MRVNLGFLAPEPGSCGSTRDCWSAQGTGAALLRPECPSARAPRPLRSLWRPRAPCPAPPRPDAAAPRPDSGLGGGGGGARPERPLPWCPVPAPHCASTPRTHQYWTRGRCRKRDTAMHRPPLVITLEGFSEACGRGGKIWGLEPLKCFQPRSRSVRPRSQPKLPLPSTVSSMILRIDWPDLSSSTV